MIKRFLIALLCVLPFASNAQQQVKLGHIDVQALFFSLPDVKDIETKMKDIQAQYEKEIKDQNDEFTRKFSDFQQNYDKMDDAIRKMRQDELEQLKQKIDNFYQTAQTSLAQKQEEMQVPVRKKILDAISEVSKENGFTYVFDTAALLYKGEAGTDLTELVLKKLGVNSVAK